MASFSSDDSVEGALYGPSHKDFFVDSNKPSTFASTREWDELRNKCFFIGSRVRDKRIVSGQNVSFTDDRAVCWDIARKMNILQEYYLVSKMVVGVAGRQIAELIIKQYEPPGGFNSQSQTGGKRLRETVNCPKVIHDALDVVNKLGNRQAHVFMNDITPLEKAIVASTIFDLASAYWSIVAAAFPAEAAQATSKSSTLTTQGVTATAWGTEASDVPSALGIWLEEKSLLSVQDAFTETLSLLDIEDLEFLKAEYDSTDADIVALRGQLKFGERNRLAKALGELNGASTVAE